MPEQEKTALPAPATPEGSEWGPSPLREWSRRKRLEMILLRTELEFWKRYGIERQDVDDDDKESP